LALFEVEGLADLIDAETEAQRKQAQRLFAGDFGQKVNVWHENLLVASALMEATIDFADDDVPVDVWPEVSARLIAVRDDLRVEIAGASAAERIRNGFEVVLIGPPNVGKSSLLNALAGRDVAMTSAVAGTTRDIVEVRMDVRGLPVTVLDTAGLRDTADPLESEGIRRARARAIDADLRILVVDRVSADWSDPHLVPDMKVASKCDLGWRPDGYYAVSAQTREGMADFVNAIAARVESVAGAAGIVIHERHRHAAQMALSQLEIAMGLVETSGETELVANAVRMARVALERLIGRIDVEDLLAAIFQRFCIGK
jgi:tRNA modification GTPase